MPLIVLIVWMFFLNRRPEEAGLWRPPQRSSLDFLTPGMRIGWQKLLKILLNAGRGMLEIAAITGLAGVVIGVLSLTGLGFTLDVDILNIGESNALLLLVLTAIVNMILGMGYADDCRVHPFGGSSGAGALPGGHCSHRGSSVHFLFWHAEHDHAAGLPSGYAAASHGKNRSDPKPAGRACDLRDRRIWSFSFLSFRLLCC